MESSRIVVLCGVMVALALIPWCTVATGAVTINEIRIDQPSTDEDEYFELAGDPGFALDGLTYIVIGDLSAGSGVVEAAIDLTGSQIPLDGYFLAADSTFSLGVPDLVVSPLNFENSDNVTHMLVSGFTGSNAQDLDTNDDGVLDVTPWASVVDLLALVEEPNPPSSTEFHYGPPAIGPDGSLVPSHVYRLPDGSGPWHIGAFDLALSNDTPGAANAGPAAVPEPAGLVLIGIGLMAVRKRRR